MNTDDNLRGFLYMNFLSIIFVLPLLFVSLCISAMERILGAVNQHPAIIEQQNAIASVRARVLERSVASSPKVSFSTTGKVPFLKNIDRNKDRLDEDKRTYLDGNLIFSKPLFDGGRRESLVNAERFREKAELIRLNVTYAARFYELLNYALDGLRSEARLASLLTTINMLSESQEEVRRRFEMGAGTLIDVRRLELAALDLETEELKLKKQLALSSRSLKDAFDLNLDDIRLEISDFIKKIPDPNVMEFDGLSLLTPQVFYQEQAALKAERASIMAERRPEVNLTLNTTLYDVTTQPFSEYEVYGGISLEQPVFDGGAREARVNGLDIAMIMEGDKADVFINERRLEWRATEMVLSEYRSDEIQEVKRQENLSKAIDSLKKRFATIDPNLVELTETNLELAQSKRRSEEIIWGMRALAFQRADISGRLLDYLDIPFPANR